jgi:hypothetical protein
LIVEKYRARADSDVSALSVKCGALRFLFIDEVEATGTEVIGQLDYNVKFHVSSSNAFKYDGNKRLRPFGGVNVFFLGDFWQLRPTGQIAIMSDPFAEKCRENAKAYYIMGMFWYMNFEDSLQPWRGKERMLHLDVNERSGADKWFSDILNACREGALGEDDYNFLHGYPTAPIKDKDKPDINTITFWYHRRHINAGKPDEPHCHYTPYHIHKYWDCYPREENFECEECWTERKRRARVLLLDDYPDEARERLTQPSFSKAVLITPYNVMGSD